MSQSVSAPARRRPLTRDAVLRAAMDLADEEGLASVSMRRLAERLAVVPMALYKHVADKEDLVDGMVDVLLLDIPTPEPLPVEQWRPAMYETLLATRFVVTAHPWARRALETRTVRTPTVLAHMERVSQILLRAGFSPDLTHHVMHLIGARLWGISPELFTDPTGSPAQRRRTTGDPDASDYPGILSIAADAQARRPDSTGCDEDREFRFAVEVILEGVDRLHRTGWTSTGEDPDEVPGG